MAKLFLTHQLPFSAQKVWRSVCQPSDLIAISLPLLRIEPIGRLPAQFMEGLEFSTRLFLFSFVPFGGHIIHFNRWDEKNFSYQTKEHGKNITSWIHDFRITPISDSQCLCEDEIQFDAGIHTPFVWSFSQALYRYRYLRRKQLLSS